MKIGMVCGHIGSSGLKPSSQHGGGELHTFAFLSILNKYYDVTAFVPQGFYPAFDLAGEYGIDLSGLKWRPLGDDLSEVATNDIMIAMDHNRLFPPVCRRNIMSVMFPQYPNWDVSLYDTFIANSEYTARWIRAYWGRVADVVYPPIALDNLVQAAGEYQKKNRIVSVGRFFYVPGGNNKNHLVLIDAFKRLMLPDWELLLIGSVQDRVYFDKVLKAIGEDRRIKIAQDLSRAEYARAIAESKLLWAATGYQDDPDTDPLPPSSMEHFGVFGPEAAKLGVLPLVYNDGGTPEGPVMTWDTVDDLVSFTLGLIRNPKALANEQNIVQAKADNFSIEKQAARLLDVIEKPILLMPSPNKAKIFITRPDRSQIHLGLISDSPEITTGFGNVTRMVARGLRELGWTNITILGWQDPHYGPPHYEDEFRTWRAWPGKEPLDLVTNFIKREGIDIAYLNYDLGNIRNVLERMNSERAHIPVVAYAPVESAPVIDQMIDTIRMTQLFGGETILYTRWAVQKVLEAGGPRCEFAYHGSDHANFRLPHPEAAQALREAVGWQDKFVVFYAGRNKRTKNILTLLDTAQWLKDHGHNDIVFYIHTALSENIPNSSGPVDEGARMRGIEDIVYFPIDLDMQIFGVPYDEPRNITVEKTEDYRTNQLYTLASMTFIERLWLASMGNGCYANASMAEGFGLVPLEAMACGVPVASVDDEGVQREVLGAAPVYVRSPMERREYWNTGGVLRNFNPEDMAQAILAIKEDRVPGAKVEDIIQEGVEQARSYRWAGTAQILDEALLRRVSL